jgi:hypothetical protein
MQFERHRKMEDIFLRPEYLSRNRDQDLALSFISYFSRALTVWNVAFTLCMASGFRPHAAGVSNFYLNFRLKFTLRVVIHPALCWF